MAKAARKAISKKVRFEVFKRDSFTCQYCGKAAPDVILHIDHIDPVSKGGDNSIINLITSCADCNGGKSNRALDDQSILAKQRDQLAALSERREQLELMVQWRTALLQMGNVELKMLTDEAESALGFVLNEQDKAALKKLLRKHGFEASHKAMHACLERYVDWDANGDPTGASINMAFRKMDNAASYSSLPTSVQTGHYCRGILKNRFPDDVYPGSYAWTDCLDTMSQALSFGYDEREMKDAAKAAESYDDFDCDLMGFIAHAEYHAATPEGPAPAPDAPVTGFAARGLRGANQGLG